DTRELTAVVCSSYQRLPRRRGGRSLEGDRGAPPLTRHRLRPKGSAVRAPLDPLEQKTAYEMTIREDLSTATGRPFEEQKYELFTALDTIFKFPELSDEDLLTLIQEKTFGYFWEGADQNSGMARERNTSGTTVTTGGTGFGLMAMIVAVERGFISRTEALERWNQIFNFLRDAE